jgi:nucleoside phosphorylase
VIADDGASRALGAPERITLESSLAADLAGEADAAGTIATCDLFYDPEHDGRLARWRSAGALAIEMEAAALAAVAARRSIRFGCLLAVSDILHPDGARERIGTEALEAAGLRLGRAALAALDRQPHVQVEH